MKNNKWFTLIEVIVSITIFSLMMVSVIMIFAEVSKLNRKIEVNRAMQENLKKSIDHIAEDVRLFEYDWRPREVYLESDWTLVVWTNKYYLWKKTDTWTFVITNNATCSDKTNNEICYIIKDSLWQKSPLTNSDIHFEYLNFSISNKNWTDSPTRVTTLATVIAPKGSFVNQELVEKTRINLQTTFWKRIIPNVK